jgi:hypothetical protein
MPDDEWRVAEEAKRQGDDEVEVEAGVDESG